MQQLGEAWHHCQILPATSVHPIRQAHWGKVKVWASRSMPASIPEGERADEDAGTFWDLPWPLSQLSPHLYLSLRSVEYHLFNKCLLSTKTKESLWILKIQQRTTQIKLSSLSAFMWVGKRTIVPFAQLLQHSQDPAPSPAQYPGPEQPHPGAAASSSHRCRVLGEDCQPELKSGQSFPPCPVRALPPI